MLPLTIILVGVLILLYAKQNRFRIYMLTALFLVHVVKLTIAIRNGNYYMLPRWLSILKYERRGARINEKLCIFGQQIFSGALDKHRASFAHASTLLLHNFLLHVIILNHSHQGTLLAKYPFTLERVAAIVSVHTMTVLQTVTMTKVIFKAPFITISRGPYVTSRAMHFAFTIFAFVTISRKA